MKRFLNYNNNQVTFYDTFRKLQSRLSDFVIATYIGITDADIPRTVPAAITHSSVSCKNLHLCFNQEQRGTAHTIVIED